MPGTTPLLGVAYPLGTEAPDGATQMETIARGLEKYGVIVAANTTARDALITSGLRHDGTVCWLSGTNELQVYDGSAWQTAYTAGDKPVRRGESLPSASGEPNGSLFSRTTDEALFLNTGSDWQRILDGSDINTGNATIDQSAQSTSSLNGETKAGVFAECKVPDSGKILVTVSAQMKCSVNTGSVFFGFKICESPDNCNEGQSWFWFNKQRAARVTRDEYESASWSTVIGVGANHSGKTARVWGMHAVGDDQHTGTYISRDISAIPVR